jgi:hypothetical protein
MEAPESNEVATDFERSKEVGANAARAVAGADNPEEGAEAK